MSTDHGKFASTHSDISASSKVRLVLDQIERSKRISAPKLAAKTKISTEELDTVLRDLSEEGLVRIRMDKMGFNRIEFVEERARQYQGGQSCIF